MRLIDADQLKVVSWRAQGGRGVYESGFDDGVDYVVRKIDKAETVEAIPVEWLWQMQDKMLSLPQFLFEECATVGKIIIAWQKEQEAQDG